MSSRLISSTIASFSAPANYSSRSWVRSQTTQLYINMARQLQPAVEKLYVPDLPRLAENA
jgi:hypothetical protein